MHSHYAADNMIVAAAGKVNHKQFVKMIEERMTGIPEHISFEADKQVYIGGYRTECKDIEQTHIVLGFKGASYLNPDYYQYSVLSTIFGGGMSSRLFQEIREKRGLVYTIHAYASAETDTGIWGVYAGTGEKELKVLMPVLLDELKKATHKITPEEVKQAQTRIEAALLMRNEDISEHADMNAIEMLRYGKVRSKESLVKEIQSVTAKDVQRYAAKLFATTPTVSCLGPIKNIMDYKDILKNLKG
jgi:predicted Zn-dependent peptidase